MRHLLFFLAVFCLFLAPFLASAQDDIAVYTVTDVATDVASDNASHARDQAVAQAQRLAFGQLLDRLGSPSSIAKKASDNDIATLVKNFEVQNERTSAVRYLGTFTVQFKPTAVRNYLGNHNATYSETRSSPVVVLPVTIIDGHPVLWEQKTKWRSVWENSSVSGGRVPVAVPAGDLQDIAAISTNEAIQGKDTSIKAIMDKYQAHGAVVAVLTGDLDKPGTPFKVSSTHYDADGDATETTDITLPASTNKAGIDSALAQAMQQVRHQMEKDWQAEDQDNAPTAEVIVTSTTTTTTASSSHTMPLVPPGGPTTHLPITVATNTLAEWAQMRHKLDSIPLIVHTDVISLQRGSTSIELEFHGSLDALQFALNQQNLVLQQDAVNKVWVLSESQIGGY